MFLSGTLLNVVAVLLGTTLGLLAGSRMPARLQSTLTDGLGMFTIVIGLALARRLLADGYCTSSRCAWPASCPRCSWRRSSCSSLGRSGRP